jgi:hypothetical protein
VTTDDAWIWPRLKLWVPEARRVFLEERVEVKHRMTQPAPRGYDFIQGGGHGLRDADDGHMPPPLGPVGLSDSVFAELSSPVRVVWDWPGQPVGESSHDGDDGGSRKWSRVQLASFHASQVGVRQRHTLPLSYSEGAYVTGESSVFGDFLIPVKACTGRHSCTFTAG